MGQYESRTRGRSATRQYHLWHLCAAVAASAVCVWIIRLCWQYWAFVAVTWPVPAIILFGSLFILWTRRIAVAIFNRACLWSARHRFVVLLLDLARCLLLLGILIVYLGMFFFVVVAAVIYSLSIVE